MKIAVTAANGQLGSAIIKQLLTILNNQNIVAIARTPEKSESLGVEGRKGDYNEKDQFYDALQDIDSILLVSGMAAPDKRIAQHRNVIKAAKEAGVKKIVYTSVIGKSQGSAFSPIVASNRQTEEDLKNSGLEWVIGRNGLYIEPDIEYIENYKKAGKIANCAGEGKCSYTTRDELGFAYAKMLTEEKHYHHIYNLGGVPLTQQQLTDYLNETFNTHLIYESMSVEEYQKERIAELGEFMGTIIAGIYTGIRNGVMQFDSDFKSAAGREHINWADYFEQQK